MTVQLFDQFALHHSDVFCHEDKLYLHTRWRIELQPRTDETIAVGTLVLQSATQDGVYENGRECCSCGIKHHPSEYRMLQALYIV